MKNQLLIKRYTLGLINALKDEKEFEVVFRELCDFIKILSARRELHNILIRPFLPSSKKKKIVEKILSKASVQKKSSHFILLLIDNERLELLSGIIKIMPDLWNEEKGILNYEVESVVPLSDSQKRKLQHKLEYIENRPVALKYKIESSLIGGISLRKGNIVYDISLKGDLEKIREQIIEG